MTSIRPRVRVPASARPGEPVRIRTLINHPMHSGQGVDAAGNPVPRRLIHRFSCSFEGESVIEIDLGPGIAASPYFEFDAVIDRAGVFQFAWHDEDGSVFTETAAIELA